MLEKNATKMMQICAINILGKIIINCPNDVLSNSLELITDKILYLLK